MPGDTLRIIALVGLPGVGKSTLGRRLATKLGRAFYDTDNLVERSVGRSVAEIFEQDGEPRFRELEADALEQVAQLQQPLVLATGGGIVTHPRSHAFLAGSAVAVYLRLAQERLVARLERSDKRPMFHLVDVAATLALLHAQRDPLYRSVARLVIDVDGNSVPRTIECIAEQLADISGTPGVASPLTRP